MASVAAAYVGVPGVAAAVKGLAFEISVAAEAAVPGIIGFTGSLIMGFAPTAPAANWGSIAAWSYQFTDWLRKR